MRIAVAGGTGTVGRLVVERARERGHEVYVLSRSEGVDLAGDEPLDLSGVGTIIDVASIETASAAKSKAFFAAVTRKLLAAGQAAGVGHYLLLSIVGIDQAPHGYYAGKLEQERLTTEGPLPWTILRATQFHEFAGQIFTRMKVGPVSVVPVMQSQPVAAGEVATRLIDLAEVGPSERVPDLAGPKAERMADLSRRWAEATGTAGRVVELPLPGGLGRGMRDGTLLARPDAHLGRQSFEQWLADTVRDDRLKH